MSERAFLVRLSSCNSSPTVMMLPEFRDRVYSRRAAGEEYVAADGGKVGRYLLPGASPGVL